MQPIGMGGRMRSQERLATFGITPRAVEGNRNSILDEGWLGRVLQTGRTHDGRATKRRVGGVSASCGHQTDAARWCLADDIRRNRRFSGAADVVPMLTAAYLRPRLAGARPPLTVWFDQEGEQSSTRLGSLGVGWRVRSQSDQHSVKHARTTGRMVFGCSSGVLIGQELLIVVTTFARLQGSRGTSVCGPHQFAVGWAFLFSNAMLAFWNHHHIPCMHAVLPLWREPTTHERRIDELVSAGVSPFRARRHDFRI
jgi:hypothetical protein